MFVFGLQPVFHMLTVDCRFNRARDSNRMKSDFFFVLGEGGGGGSISNFFRLL